MKKRVKQILLGIVVLLIVGAIAVNIMQPLSVDTVVIEHVAAEAYFTELGHVREDRLVEIYSLVGGEIISVNVTEGQFINEGDILVVVDASDILHEIEQLRVNNTAIYAQIANLSAEEAQTRTSHAANRDVLQAELSAIDAQEQMALVSDTDRQRVRDESIRLQNIIIEQSRQNVQNAEDDLATARTLFNAGIITQTELDAREQALNNQRVDLTSNEAQLEIINSEFGTINQSEHFAALRSSVRAQIAGIDRSLAQLSTESTRQHFTALIESNNLAISNLERKANNSVVTSPVSGTILSLNVDSTNILNPAIPVAEIRTEADNLIEVYVSTSNINDLNVGDTVDLIFIRQNEDVLYSGTIYSIDDRAVAMVSILGVEERRVEVLIEPDDVSNSFRSGFDVDVRFVTYFEENRITVPRTAVFEEAGQSMVYVVDRGTASQRPVVVGPRLRTDVVVESGLDIGDIVIRNARQDGLRNGVRVAH